MAGIKSQRQECWYELLKTKRNTHKDLKVSCTSVGVQFMQIGRWGLYLW